MMIELTDYDLKILRNIEEKTHTDFKITKDNTINAQNLLSVIDELYCALNHLSKEIKDIEQDRDDNYKPIPVSEQVGISDKDFL